MASNHDELSDDKLGRKNSNSIDNIKTDSSLTNEISNPPVRQFKSNNPFLQSNDLSQSYSTINSDSTTSFTNIQNDIVSNEPEIKATSSSSSHSPPPLPIEYTMIKTEELIQFPFKTINRILDDIRFTAAYKKIFNVSLLNTKPINYASNLSNLVNSSNAGKNYEILTLDNHLDHAPNIERIDLNTKDQNLIIIRGLLINRSLNELYHFKIQILERKPSQFVNTFIDKHEYHIIPKNLVSQDDLDSLQDSSINSDDLIDDAFFKSLNGPNNHILRVSIFNPEFTNEDLKPISNQEYIKSRYLKALQDNSEINLSPETIPSPIQCFETLLKVLRGPVILGPDQPIQTISIKGTNLDAKIDIDLLYNKLSFIIEDNDSLVPPLLSTNPSLKESYIRKITELIFVGKGLKLEKQVNDFDIKFSFSDNCNLIHRALNEVDKHISVASGYDSNQLPFYTTLSASIYFQDELIIKCFENTYKSDLINKPHYIDALKYILYQKAAQAPNKLRTYYNNLASKGDFIGYNDYVQALKSLGIELSSDNVGIDDDFIIAMYLTSYKNDSKNYTYFNKNLKLIAKVRNSDILNKFIEREIIPFGLALDALSVEEITEDEVVLTAFEFRLDELLQASNFQISDDVVFLYKSLASIAIYRKSYILMNYLETKNPQMIGINHDYTFKDACSILGVDTFAKDFEIISKFQELLTQSQVDNSMTKIDEYDRNDIRVLRQSLKAIAMTKNSKILLSFLTSGKVDSTLLPVENWPAGLDNIGNTCYLNSLLQYYFCLKPLRDAILNFNEKNYSYINYNERKIGGRKVEESEIKRSIQFIYHLRNLFKEMIHTDKRCVKPSKELAYLSFLPLSQPVNFKSAHDKFVEQQKNEQVVEVFNDDDAISHNDENVVLVHSQSPSPEKGHGNDDIEMKDNIDVKVNDIDDNEIKRKYDDNEKLVDAQSPSDDNLNDPEILEISTDQMESTIEVGGQQDVTECIENVTFQIETALEPDFIEEDGEQYDLIKKLFYGKTKQTITPLTPGKSKESTRTSTERFFSLIINVSDHPKDIYDSLDSYFSEDTVNLDEGLVQKSLTVKEIPDVLQFHVQRVLFDREKLMAYKSLEPIPFSEQIYLDRYLDTDDADILNKRLEIFKWKSEINKLHEKKDAILKTDEESKLSIIDSLIATKKYLENKIKSSETLSIKDETILAIQAQIDELKNQLQEIHNQLNNLQDQVSKQFINYNKVGYSIFAIFIHRGEASYGHYWIYIKDPRKNIFRKYNDETVTEVPASEVLNFTEGNTATPYYIVYVKNSLMDDYVEPLKRVTNKC